VAISDLLGLTAQPLDTWVGLGREGLLEQIDQLIREFDVCRVVVGHPLTLRGEEGRMAQEVNRFVKILRKKLDIPVVLWDERLTSVQAERILHDAGEKPSSKKERIDQLASVLLLQNYLDYQNQTSSKVNGEEH
jgi:putative Holliday junction resolvase